MNRREIEIAVQRALDSELSDDEMAELRGVLKSDPSARALYYEYVALHQALGYRLRPYFGTATRKVVDSHLCLQSRMLARSAFSVAAAILLCLGIVLTLIFTRPHPPLATLKCSQGSVHTIRHTSSDSGHSPDELTKRSRVDVKQGVVEVGFRSGARAVVLAPAAFEIQGEQSMQLFYGRAWVRISDKSVGFQVQTPEISVADLGTEFGVISDPSAGDEVHVFDGLVRAGCAGPMRSVETLGAGQARVCDPVGRLSSIKPRPEEFLTGIPAAPPGGLIVNGGFESGNPPPDARFGRPANPATLPGWTYGPAITIALRDETGCLGYGERGSTVCSPTSDKQVVFQDDTWGFPPPADVTLRQTFATVAGTRYRVRFSMGGYFSHLHTVSLVASVYDGADCFSADPLAQLADSRSPDLGNGYNPPRDLVFTARSAASTLEFVEVSPNSCSADPVLDNVAVEPLK